MRYQEKKDPFKLFSFISGSEFEGEYGGGSPAPETTPVVQTPEQIEEGIAKALAGEEVVEPIEPINTTPTEPVKKVETPTPTPAPTPTPGTFTPNAIWDALKKDYESQVGENTFVMPEGVTAENEHQKLIEFFQKNVEPDIENLHPFAKEVLKAASEENFDPNKFLESKVKQKTYLDLPNDEFLKLHLMNIAERDKTGWTEEDILNHIENKKKDKIGFDAEVNSLKGQYKEYENKLAADNEIAQKAKAKQEFETQIEKRNKDIATLIEQNKTVNDFFGIQYGEAELKEFHTWLPQMLQVDKETGSYPLLDYLRSDNNLLKVAAVVFRGEKGMKDYLADLKEGVKSDLMTKLRITPQNDGGTIVKNGGVEPITGFE